MDMNRSWIEKNRKELTGRYPGKMIFVVHDQIVRVLDPIEDVLEVNRIGRELAQGGEWAYTVLSTAKGLL